MSEMHLEKGNKESVAISIIRNVATVMIVMCHVANWFPRIQFAGQILNVGVPLFFIISGFIYGQKVVSNPVRWFTKRWIRISVPLYIYYIITLGILFLVGNVGNIGVLYAVNTFLHLQGFVWAGIGNVMVSHLWFISYIMLCYSITPILQYFRECFQLIGFICIGVFVLFINALLVIYGFIDSYWIPGVALYSAAYYLAAFWNRKVTVKGYSLLTVLMLVANVARLYCKYLVEINCASLMYLMYEGVISVLTHCIFASWIFITLLLFIKRYDSFFERHMKTVRVLDKFSYDIYITHYMFLLGFFDIRHYTNSIFNAICLFVVLTLIASVLLHMLTKIIMDAIEKWSI